MDYQTLRLYGNIGYGVSSWAKKIGSFLPKSEYPMRDIITRY